MLRLHSQEDIRAAIRRRGNEIAAKMSDKEIFTSNIFIRYATNLADFLLRKHRLYSLKVVYDPSPNATIAYTDGKNIVLNAGNCIAAKPKLLERRFKVNMGILFHEVAHKLFLDFPFSEKAIDAIMSGTPIGAFPTAPEQTDAVNELLTAISMPCYRSALASIFHNVSNIINDGHDESAMKRCFPGFISECITVAGEVQMEQATPLETMCLEGWDAYSIYSSLFLHYAKYGYYKEGNPTAFGTAYLEKMKEVEGVIDSALLEDNYEARWNYINALVVFLWPILKNKFPEDPPIDENSSGNGGSQGSGGSQNGQNSGGNQSQNSSGNGGGSGQQAQNSTSEEESEEEQSQSLQSLLDELANAAQQSMNTAPAPVNGTEKAMSEEDVATGTSPSSAGGLNEIMQELTHDKAEKEIQKELDKAQMDAIRNCNMPLVHEKVKTIIHQHVPADKAAYEAIAKEVDPLAKNLIAQMKALFREMNESYVQHHKAFGPIIEATESYRLDKKFFAKKKLPDDYPDMALVLLIDQSGSMYGEKNRCAQRTAILLEKFASGLDIPIMIAGHSTDDYKDAFLMNIFMDFNSARKTQERYSLGNMETLDCNRDGYAVRLCADLLAKRPERVKLMISISDGSPYHNTRNGTYSGEEARADINQAVKDYRRKGLLIYGAAIDDDKDVIEEIYGKGFLSIQNLSALPKTLVRLVKQQMI